VTITLMISSNQLHFPTLTKLARGALSVHGVAMQLKKPGTR
jgi:hypothetical protein